MKFTLEMSLDSEAFQPLQGADAENDTLRRDWQIDACLVQASKQVQRGATSGVLYDENGARSGQWAITEPALTACELDDQDAKERAEYEALTDLQRLRYDEMGQDGGTHLECMLYVSTGKKPS